MGGSLLTAVGVTQLAAPQSQCVIQPPAKRKVPNTFRGRKRAWAEEKKNKYPQPVLTLLECSQTGVMDKALQNLKEQLAVEKFIEADQVFARDPLEFLDKDGNRIDDRIQDVDEI